MTTYLHVLKGCSPVPLASYLKALGILRIVGEQADSQARGWWEGEYFRLLTKLSREELEAFFLTKYEPTPLLSPWNKGCGFFKANAPGLCPLENSTALRFKRFRDGVVAARQLLNEISRADAAIRAIKARTKTTKKGFQSVEQRQLLEKDETYRRVLQQLEERLKEQLKEPNPAPQKVAETKADLETIESLTRPAEPPAKREAESLKTSTGYKRLLAAADRCFNSLKAALIPDCRRLWRGPHAEWLSAALVLDEAGTANWPALLGTGGNDGNLDFTNNFMQQLGTLFELASEDATPKTASRELLANALWMEPANKLTSAAVGQYQPGSAGGANSSTGYAGGGLVSPWDFVLMLEGSILFTARATRRLDPNAFSRASAPFAVRPHAVGFATPGSENTQRGEQWVPLWGQPATLREIAATFGEARVQLGRQPANRPLDMARSICRLGAARGVECFVRYGYLERNGQSTLAVPLGRVRVRHQPRAYLIDDLAGWMERIQRRSRDKNAPARMVHAERRLADAAFAALTHDNAPDRWQAVLLAAGEIESLQATGAAIEAGPIPPLRPDWVAAAADGGAEVRLALALGSAAAGYTREGRPIDSVRHHWLPLGREKRLANDPRVVMSGRDPIRDLAATVERRLIEAGMKGQRRSRLVPAAGCGARLDDLARFLAGTLDLEKLLGLARAFMAVKWGEWSRECYPRSAISGETPDECWLTVRLACLPWPLTRDKDIPADQRIVRLLISGDSERAIEIARTRLRSVGVRLPMQAGVTDMESARRWAAALAFPIHRSTALRASAILDPSMKGQFHA